MSNRIILIEKNTAVKALANLALNGADFQVEVIEQTALAEQRALESKPRLVICSADIAGLDPLQLPKQLRTKLKETKFLLLASEQQAKLGLREAKNAGYHDVLLKPFKSHKLRETVLSLLSKNESDAENQDLSHENTAGTALSEVELSFDVSDSLRKEILQAIIQKTWPGSLDVKQAQPKKSVLITDQAPTNSARGKQEVIFLGSEKQAQIKLPLNEMNVIQAMEKVLGPAKRGSTRGSIPQKPQHIEKAAEIAAEVFKQLLSSSNLDDKLSEELRKLLAER